MNHIEQRISEWMTHRANLIRDSRPSLKKSAVCVGMIFVCCALMIVGTIRTAIFTGKRATAVAGRLSWS